VIDAVIWTLLAVTLIGEVVLSAIIAVRLTAIYRILRDNPTAGRAVTTHRAAGRAVTGDGRRPDEVVTGPPILDGVTLYQWMSDRNPLGHNVWSKVVAEFYTDAAGEPEIAAYFAATLAKPNGWEILQQHFLRVLMMVADKGVTVGDLRYLRAKHWRVSTPDGHRITGPVYDAVVNVLVGSLRRHGVPPQGIEALAATIEPIRAEIVRA